MMSVELEMLDHPRDQTFVIEGEKIHQLADELERKMSSPEDQPPVNLEGMRSAKRILAMPRADGNGRDFLYEY